MHSILAKIQHWHDAGFIEFLLWVYVFYSLLGLLTDLFKFIIIFFSRKIFKKPNNILDKFMKVRRH